MKTQGTCEKHQRMCTPMPDQSLFLSSWDGTEGTCDKLFLTHTPEHWTRNEPRWRFRH